MKPKTHEHTFRVRIFETDFDTNVPVTTICNYMQEVAGMHAEKLSIGMGHLLERDVAWALSRFHVTMKRLPTYGESVTIKTFAICLGKYVAERDFIVFVGDEEVGRGASHWVVFNFNDRKMIQIPDFIHDNFPGTQDHVCELPTRNVPRLRNVDPTTTFTVRLSDQDTNNHVNNVRYLDWAIEDGTKIVGQDKRPLAIDASFRAEARYGDTVLASSATQDDGSVLHSLCGSDGPEFCRIKTIWG